MERRPYQELNDTVSSLELWKAPWAKQKLKTMNTQWHQSAARVTFPGTAWQPGFGAKKFNTWTDLGYISTELVQPKCLMGEGSWGYWQETGSKTDHVIGTSKQEGKVRESSWVWEGLGGKKWSLRGPEVLTKLKDRCGGNEWQDGGCTAMVWTGHWTGRFQESTVPRLPLSGTWSWVRVAEMGQVWRQMQLEADTVRRKGSWVPTRTLHRVQWHCNWGVEKKTKSHRKD